MKRPGQPKAAWPCCWVKTTLPKSLAEPSIRCCGWKRPHVREIGRLQAKIDVDLDRSVSARGRVGVWSQNLDILRDSAANQVVSLNEQLSEAIDTDFAKVVSDLNSRQTSLEASMRLVGQTSQLSVLNFL